MGSEGFALFYEGKDIPKKTQDVIDDIVRSSIVK